MDRTKVAKACEPCRRRKTKCDGEAPCINCQSSPLNCRYRLKARIRNRAPRHSASPSPSELPRMQPELHAENNNEQTPEVVETQNTQPICGSSVALFRDASQNSDRIQIFYGPSSNFAFLQQLHRIILSSHASGATSLEGPQRGDLGLDVFMQRDVFFGVPSLMTSQMQLDRAQQSRLDALISQPVAEQFLENFKFGSLHLLPFIKSASLSVLLSSAYASDPDPASETQRSILLPLTLAIGACHTPHTELAEALFTHAKQKASIFEDAVTLPMIQASILMADYQINIGRPNSSYLYVGVACRKALAMGLQAQTGNAYSNNPEEDEERRTTMWTLYFIETWGSLTAGRKAMIQKSDIAYPLPCDQPFLVSICGLAEILEDVVQSIYGRNPETLWQLYENTQTLHARLRAYGEELRLGTTSVLHGLTISTAIPLLILHNSERAQAPLFPHWASVVTIIAYFHLIYTTFRPFLIAETAVQSSPKADIAQELWFRRACRVATDAAKDLIIFVNSIFRRIDVGKVRRYDCYFLEASCSILLHDSLCHPLNHTTNLEYINMALVCLKMMAADVPVTNISRSIEQILRTVERHISSTANSTPPVDPLVPQTPSHSRSNVMFPPFDASQSVNELIFMRDMDPMLNTVPRGDDSLVQTPLPPALDIVTTDLLNFFPMDLSANGLNETWSR